MFAAASCFHIIANDSTWSIKGEKTALVGPSACKFYMGSEEFARGHRAIESNLGSRLLGEYSRRFTWGAKRTRDWSGAVSETAIVHVWVKIVFVCCGWSVVFHALEYWTYSKTVSTFCFTFIHNMMGECLQCERKCHYSCKQNPRQVWPVNSKPFILVKLIFELFSTTTQCHSVSKFWHLQFQYI